MLDYVSRAHEILVGCSSSGRLSIFGDFLRIFFIFCKMEGSLWEQKLQNSSLKSLLNLFKLFLNFLLSGLTNIYCFGVFVCRVYDFSWFFFFLFFFPLTWDFASRKEQVLDWKVHLNLFVIQCYVVIVCHLVKQSIWVFVYVIFFQKRYQLSSSTAIKRIWWHCAISMVGWPTVMKHSPLYEIVTQLQYLGCRGCPLMDNLFWLLYLHGFENI